MENNNSYLYFDAQPELVSTRKLMQTRVTDGVLWNLLKADGMKFQIHSRIPKTAQLARVVIDVLIGDIIVIFYDESFEEIGKGALIPYFRDITVIEQIYEKETQA